jgi:hypothetical protein
MEDRSLDDAVMGGGLAALSPAVQLERRDSGIDVLAAERAPHPPPVAAHEVGESKIEAGAHHYREVLGLESYLAAEQLPKSGLRWFLSEARNTDIAQCVEYRPRAWLAVVALLRTRRRSERGRAAAAGAQRRARLSYEVVW